MSNAIRSLTNNKYETRKQENKMDFQLSEIDHVDDQNVINNADHEDFNDQQWQNSLHIDDKPENEKPDEEIKNKVPMICRFFKNGTCKYGLKGRDCRFDHPKPCKKFIQHGTRQPRGCNLGKKCKLFHPKMCFDSLRKGECFFETCRYTI